ncbi:MAG: AgmX/PglI C-terminal domain-containing protein [Myxococcales bacterium]|nr:AgmX/PglI C-terminal domain-containing protein [Myxococcales bacterium]
MPIPITFHIYEGGQHTRSESYNQDVIKIGKLDSSHLRIDDEAVSRMHSVIEVSGPGEVYIIDLGSASGTIVNGQKVNKSKLENGDQIQFGNTIAQVELTAAAVEQAPQAPVAQPPAAATMQMAVAPAAEAYAAPAPVQPSQPPLQNPFAQQQAPAAGQQLPNPFAQQAAPAVAHAAAPVAQPVMAAGSGMVAEAVADYGEAATYQLVPVAPPVNPADVDSAETAVEVVIMWGELSILHVEHLSPPRGFYVGEATDAKGKPATDFLIGSESVGTDRLPVTVESGASVAVVIPQGASGDVTINDQRISFAELAAQGQLQACSELAGAQQYPLPPGATARVVYRGFTFVVKPMSMARRVGIGGSPYLDWKEYMWTIASMAFHVGMLLLFYFLPPRSSSLSLDLLNADSRLVKYLIEPPETVEEETPEWLDDSKMDDEEGGKGKRHKDEEGAMGKKDEKKTTNKFGIEGPEDNQDPQMARDEAKEMAANAGIIGILKASVGAWNSPTSPYGADTALGNDPMSALGALMGDQIGGNFGFGGLGLRGTGRGGGGTGEGTIGLGNIGTIGHGAGGGTGSGYGRGAGGFRGRSAKVPHIRTGKADVRGSLSKEVIRRIIRRHINEVRFCYEQELNSRPDLQGRVSVKFIISPTGAVQTAAVANSTLGNAKAEQCIAKSVRRWTFPSPEGGGIVVVTYPFVLQQTGG